ncbi:MAG: hypothetical protein LWX51_11820 [Deltaproteobacteria bacterium]|jgi:hypothetical protein|nr:hypothetical protein [Deltaproteobacteria bacterium]
MRKLRDGRKMHHKARLDASGTLRHVNVQVDVGTGLTNWTYYEKSS